MPRSGAPFCRPTARSKAASRISQVFQFERWIAFDCSNTLTRSVRRRRHATMHREPLTRRLVAELIGSLLLAATVVGSGIMAERLAGGNLAVALLANAAATGAVLGTLIALLGPVSGAHFNPVVSLIETLRGKLTRADAVGYVIAQIVGCCAGALLAHAMFELPLWQA